MCTLVDLYISFQWKGKTNKSHKINIAKLPLSFKQYVAVLIDTTDGEA